MAILTVPVIIIIVSLVCLVPWTVVSALAVLGDYFSLRANRRNPHQGNVVVGEFEPVPEALAASERWLLELNFAPMCTADQSGAATYTREWLYNHPEASAVLASLTLDDGGVIGVEFATRFEGLSVVTMHGGSEINVHAPALIVNTVESGIEQALEYHVRVIEAEQASAGEPYMLNTPEAYQAWMNEFDVVHQENPYFVRMRRWQRFSVALAAVASLMGLAGLYLMNTTSLSDVPALVLMISLLVVIVLQIRWILRPPWEGLSVEKRLQKGKAV